LDAARRTGVFSDGDWVVMPTAGAGMSWGAVVYRWRAKAADEADCQYRVI